MHYKHSKFKDKVNNITLFLLFGFVGLSAYAVADRSGTTVWQLILTILALGKEAVNVWINSF